MKQLKRLSILILLANSFLCVFNANQLHAQELKQEIDFYLKKTIAHHQIPGLALAVVQDDGILFEAYYGKASLEENVPVDKNTLFRIFSATKLITTTGVFQLIENGALRLDDTLATYLDDLPEAWQKIKIKNLLSHSSGLPDILKYESTLSDEDLMAKLFDDNMEFETGYQFRYNQTNYWLLAQIIEKITGATFEGFILKNQFAGGNEGVLFSSNSQEVLPNRATRYFYEGKSKGFVKATDNNGARGHSGNGLNLTLDEFIKWDGKLKKTLLLDEQTKSKMWSPFEYTNDFKYQKEDFLHGWGSYPINAQKSFGFSGGNLAAYRFFPESNTSIILLSNGYVTPAYDIIVNDIARLTLPKLRAQGATLEYNVLGLIEKEEFDEALQTFKKLKRENPKFRFENLKWNINAIGNSFVWNDDFEKAMKIFELNAAANPDWWVAFAALGEVYEARKDSLNAIKCYKKAITFNEKNEGYYNEELTNLIRGLQTK
ncbi:serine hydrolase domain-containing protein [Flagellimonas sp. DF-77]|uniref:serine hydrolase domain-containing protein n=1 Tax=Flagellimonas algarum TaxID=3230298 RepID=UPI0033989B1F